MPRSEGFDVMDVSTSICDDPKFRRLQRLTPHLVAPAFTAYVACMADSWKAGRRLSLDVTWPSILPFDPAVQPALIEAGLIDKRGVLSLRAWTSWFEPAYRRRSDSRARNARANANRRAAAANEQRGDSDVTPPPSDPTVRPSGPTGSSVPPARATRGKKDDGLTTSPTREEALLALSNEFKTGRLTELEYSRQRKALA